MLFFLFSYDSGPKLPTASGPTLVTAGAPSREDCQAMCQANHKCKFFVYEKNVQCSLKVIGYTVK